MLCATIDIVANIVPRVSLVVFVGVRPSIGQIDFTSLRAHISESVEHMCELLARQILRIEITSIDCLYNVNPGFGCSLVGQLSEAY